MRYSKLTFVAGAAIAAFALASCAPSAPTPTDPEDQSLVVSIWAAYYPETLADDFEAATGIPVTIVNHATNEEILAKLLANGGEGIDVAFVSGSTREALQPGRPAGAARQGARSPTRRTSTPRRPSWRTTPATTFSMPYAWGTTGLCYRSDLVRTAPTSWNDLLTPRPTSPARPRCSRPSAGWRCRPSRRSATRSTRPTPPSSRRSRTQLRRDQGDPARLRRHDLLLEARLGRGVDGPGVGRLVQLRHRRGPERVVRDPRGGQRPLGRHHHRAQELSETRRRRWPS